MCLMFFLAVPMLEFLSKLYFSGSKSAENEVLEKCGVVGVIYGQQGMKSCVCCQRKDQFNIWSLG